MDQVIYPLKCVHLELFALVTANPVQKNNQFKMTVFSIVFVVIGCSISRGGHLGLIVRPF